MIGRDEKGGAQGEVVDDNADAKRGDARRYRTDSSFILS
jgi:hypothetical protein